MHACRAVWAGHPGLCGLSLQLHSIGAASIRITASACQALKCTSRVPDTLPEAFQYGCQAHAYPLRILILAQNMRAVDVPIYDFATHQRSAEVRRVEPADVVIIEGILVLHMEDIRAMLNMKIFVDTDDDLRLARR